jgi:hypothetical protein
LFLVTVLFPACAYYEPVPGYYPSSSYERAWESALSAAEDVGILITYTDRGSGTIQGRKGYTDVDIYVIRQADGRLRVELNLRRPEDEHRNLAERFRQSFERHMGAW